ncbi:hypothetical protein O7634_29085 [Micromonospora sp. WMMD1120]|uniref:hypothetical protein n=1 Tax=Micromonospora sp. WMMD1120 TaxID=3016106 RepID=UPI00241607CC|nr:hypothetical protein [Micromonospora sp. WMMD1120]MDG4810831.1 hypothetical protein [Micromonospora sp. WMMD1120]
MSVTAAAGPASEYLLLETRQDDTAELFVRDALTLVRAGHRVRLLLVGDGVGVAAGRARRTLTEFLADGGEVWVDDFTLVQRAIPPRSLVAGVCVVSMAQVARLLGEEHVRAVWH